MATKKSIPRRNCATMPVHHLLLETVPGFRARQVALEHANTAMLRTAMAVPAKPTVIKTVVHVLYNKAQENLSQAQIDSQIKVLNLDFRAKNTDRARTPTVFKGLIADPMIEFKLDRVTRTKTTRTAFPPDNSMKRTASGGINPVDTRKYLNIWVCTLSQNLLGYAQFPGGPASTDGVVILNSAFGTSGIAQVPFNRGRTTTHEIGHFLNLRHIWGDTEDCSGGDLVADTPNAETPNFGKIFNDCRRETKSVSRPNIINRPRDGGRVENDRHAPASQADWIGGNLRIRHKPSNRTLHANHRTRGAGKKCSPP